MNEAGWIKSPQVAILFYPCMGTEVDLCSSGIGWPCASPVVMTVAFPFLTERQIYSASSRIIPLQSVPRSKDSARAAQPSPDADPFGSVRFGSGSDMVAVGCLKVRWGEKRSLCNNKQGLFVRAMSLFSIILLYLRDLSCSSRFFFCSGFSFLLRPRYTEVVCDGQTVQPHKHTGVRVWWYRVYKCSLV